MPAAFCGKNFAARIAPTAKTRLERALCEMVIDGVEHTGFMQSDLIAEAAFHDKKADGDTVTITTVNEIGSFEMKKIRCLDVIDMAKNFLEDL